MNVSVFICIWLYHHDWKIYWENSLVQRRLQVVAWYSKVCADLPDDNNRLVLFNSLVVEDRNKANSLAKFSNSSLRMQHESGSS